MNVVKGLADRAFSELEGAVRLAAGQCAQPPPVPLPLPRPVAPVAPVARVAPVPPVAPVAPIVPVKRNAPVAFVGVAAPVAPCLSLVVQNGTGRDVFVVAKAIDASTNKRGVYVFDPDGPPRFVADADATAEDLVARRLQSPPPPLTAAIALPYATSGRLYFSVGAPLVLRKSGDDVVDPDGLDPSDPSYHVLYDKIEYTATVDGGVYVNPTAVDFFAMPIRVKLNGSDVTAGPAGATAAQREEVMKAASDARLTPLSGARVMVGTQTLRLCAPGKVLSVVGVEPPRFPAFPRDYLALAAEEVWKFYQGRTVCVRLDDYDADVVYEGAVVEVGAGLYEWQFAPRLATQPALGTPAAVKAQGGSTVAPVTSNGKTWPYVTFGNAARALDDYWANVNGYWANVNQSVEFPPPTVSYVTARDYLAGGTGALQAPNGTPGAVIARALCAAFVTGLLLQVEPGDALSKKYFGEALSGKRLYVEKGVYSDMYAKTIHENVPQLYAFAYDDALGQDGTLHTRSDAATPTILTVTLGDVADVADAAAAELAAGAQRAQKAGVTVVCAGTNALKVGADGSVLVRVGVDATADETRSVSLKADKTGAIVVRSAEGATKPFRFGVRLDPPTVTPDDAADWNAAARIVVAPGTAPAPYTVTLGAF
jgi:hypothetical protein